MKSKVKVPRRSFLRIESVCRNFPAKLVFASACLSLNACSTTSKIIVYDEPSARAVGKANLICTPEAHEICDKDVETDEAQYVDNLVAKFPTIYECKELTLIINRSVNKNAKEALERLTKAEAQNYWSLRVEYHYKLTDQVASMGLNQSKIKYALNGDDIQLLKFACQIAQDNGIHNSW